jgi:hypothetical protein
MSSLIFFITAKSKQGGLLGNRSIICKALPSSIIGLALRGPLPSEEGCAWNNEKEEYQAFLLSAGLAPQPPPPLLANIGKHVPVTQTVGKPREREGRVEP